MDISRLVNSRANRMNGAIPMRLRTHFRSERCQEPYCIAKTLDPCGWLGDQRMVQGQEVNGVSDLQQLAGGFLGICVFALSGVFHRSLSRSPLASVLAASNAFGLRSTILSL